MITNGIVFSTICILLLHLYRKNPNIRGHKYSRYIMISFILCIFRLLVPYESPVGGNIYLGHWFTPFIIYLWKSIKILNTNIYLFQVIIAIWLIVAILKCCNIIKKYHNAMTKVRLLAKESGVNKIALFPDGDFKDINLISSSKVSMPFSIAFFDKYIVLPDADYSDSELRCILMHEITHIKNRDSLIRLLVHLLCSIYWWIPFRKNIQKDIDDLIEIRCDEKVVSKMSIEEKINYLQTMIKVVKNSRSSNQCMYAAAFSTNSVNLLQERADEIGNTDRSNSLSRIIPIITASFIAVSYIIMIKPYMDIPANYFDDEYGYVFSLENTSLHVNNQGVYELIRYDGIRENISQKEANEWLKDSHFQHSQQEDRTIIDQVKDIINFDIVI